MLVYQVAGEYRVPCYESKRSCGPVWLLLGFHAGRLAGHEVVHQLLLQLLRFEHVRRRTQNEGVMTRVFLK